MVNKTPIQSLLLLILFVFPFFTQAALTSSIDRNTLSLNESFTLTLSSDQSLDEQPDFSVLEKDFDILSRQQSNSIQMINRQTTRSIQWQLNLMPRRSGQLIIPAIHAGTEHSQAIAIIITKTRSTNNTVNSTEDIFIQLEVDNNSVYVQQQIIYTIRIFLRRNTGITIANGSTLSEPVLSRSDAVTQRLGDDRQYQTTQQGRSYSIIERRYSIYPQQSGTINIQPLVFDARLLTQGRSHRFSPFANLQQNTKVKRIRSRAINIEVKPVPAEFTGRHWLPASDLSLQENWSEDITQLKTGEPVTRTLTIEVDGLSSAQIPVIEYKIPADLKQYPDQAVLNDETGYDGIHASRQQKLALIANQAGTIELPAVDIIWWNTGTNRQETARIPARTLQVTASRTSMDQSTPIVTEPRPGLAEKTDTPSHPAPKKTVKADWWPWLTLLFSLLWLGTLVLWRHGHQQSTCPAISKPDRPGASIKQLKQACQTANNKQASAALIDWGRQQWPDQGIDNLGQIASCCDTTLAEHIHTLEKSLYDRNNIQWQGQALWQAFKQQPPIKQRGQQQNKPTLNTLFKHQDL